MKRFAAVLLTLITVGLIAFSSTVSGHADEDASPIYGIKIPPGYRDWKLISVTHEEGAFDQLRAQLGNDIAIKAYREGTLPSRRRDHCRVALEASLLRRRQQGLR